MHVKVPETVYVRPINDSGNCQGWVDDDGHIIYVVPWLADPKTLNDDEVTNQTILFRERRRKDYSDVCHAKLLWSDDPITDCPQTIYKTGAREVIGGVMHYIRQPSKALGSLGSSCTVISNGRYALLVRLRGVDESSDTKRFEVFARIYRWKKKGSAWCVGSSRNMKYTRSTGKWKVSKSTPDDMHLQEYLDSMIRTCPVEQLKTRDIQEWMGTFTERVAHMLYLWRSENPEFTNSTVTFSVRKPTLCEIPSNVFLLHEPEVVMDKTDDVLLGTGTEKYFRNVLVQHAFLEMVTNVPRLSDNSISNMLEIISFIKSLVIDHRIRVPESLSDLWLTYRYSYGTGKLDAEEAIKFVHRHMDLGDWSRIKSYGQHTLNFSGVNVTCRCEAEVIPRIMSTVGRLWRSLYTYGLSPTFYTAWDMIPYSFIVDWFLPIGDVMAAWDAKRVVDEYYDFKGINTSLSYTRLIDGYHVKCYTRWLSDTPVPLQGYYFLEGSSPSHKTVLKRVLDATSLIMG